MVSGGVTAAPCRLQEGIVSSGNSLDYSKEDWDQLHAIGAAVKEMEAAGISWVAHLHNVPFLALKSITDIVDGDRPAQEEFLENLHAAAKALQVRAPDDQEAAPEQPCNALIRQTPGTG